MEALIDYLLARVNYFEAEEKEGYIEVRVKNPEEFTEAELSNVAGVPIKLRGLEDALG